MSGRVAVSIVLVLASLLGCAGRESGGAADRKPVRLADVFASAKVEGTPADAPRYPRTEWVWSGSNASTDAAGWRSLIGVSGLRVENGALRGTTEMPMPVLALDWSPPPQIADDKIQSIELKLLTSAGKRASFGVSSDQQLIAPMVMANPFAFTITGPVVAGAKSPQVFTLRPTTPISAGGIKHLLLRPADAAGADFAIESVRVVFEREHLATVPAGLSWQGLGGSFRETLAARSPETVRFDLTLPADPFFELAIGTLSPEPVTFEISVADGAGEGEHRVRRTVTTPQRWEEVRIDLGGHDGKDRGGKPARIALHLDGPAGAIGLWGSPVVRSRVARTTQPPSKPQAVVVVLIDTLRRDHLALAGYDRKTAPHLSALAKAGAVADDAISQAAWTKVSVPSILTSLYPTTHTVADMPDLLPASATTMAEVFRGAGFATLGFSAIPFTGKLTNLHQGYEQFRESGLDFSAIPNANQMPVEKAARRYIDELLPWIERHRDVPFFAMLHVEDPHAPYVPPAPYATEWGKAEDAAQLQQMTQQVRPKIANPLLQIFGLPASNELVAAGVDADEFVRIERDAYDGLIHETDDEIARLIERIDELGLTDRVLVAFVSDHGTEFLDHGQHFHGHTVYGELNRVPMFFWGPSYVPAGVHIPTTVQNLDFMPTVLDLAGLPIPKEAQGQSLRPWFAANGQEADAGAKGWRRVPAITEKSYVGAREPGGWASYSIIVDGWKLIHNVQAPAPAPGMPAGPGGTAPPGAPGFALPPPAAPPREYELYDHVEDPLNLADVADAHPDKVKELAQQLERWRAKVESERLPDDAALAAQASPEELERLRSLGYL